jgi:hypothetical protein
MARSSLRSLVGLLAALAVVSHAGAEARHILDISRDPEADRQKLVPFVFAEVAA